MVNHDLSLDRSSDMAWNINNVATVNKDDRMDDWNLTTNKLIVHYILRRANNRLGTSAHVVGHLLEILIH